MARQSWGAHVEGWKTIRPPWTPCEEDIELALRICPKDLLLRDRVRVLVLGVTPRLVHAPWPSHFEIYAVDFDRGMIDVLWQEGASPRIHLACADWRNMPFPDGHFDLVVGDGSFCALPGLSHYSAVLAELQRVRRPGARIITRFFMQTQPRARLSDIADFEAGLRLPGLTAVELRFLTLIAVCGEDATMRHGEIAPMIESFWKDLESYIAAVWPEASDARDFRLLLERDQSLNFPTIAQITEQFAPFGLKPTVHFPGYAAGRFCPTIRFD